MISRKHYEPPVGTSIMDACVEACSIAVTNAAEVEFSFNGATAFATPESNPSDVAASIEAILKLRSDEWAKSQEGIRESAQAEAVRAEEQRCAIACECLLPIIARGMSVDTAMDVLHIYLKACDHRGVEVSPKPVIDALNDAGFTAGDCVGLEASAYNDKMVCARYIIGQILDMGIPCHPVALSFIERWTEKFS